MKCYFFANMQKQATIQAIMTIKMPIAIAPLAANSVNKILRTAIAINVSIIKENMIIAPK